MKSVRRTCQRRGLRAAIVSALSAGAATVVMAAPVAADGSVPIYEFNIPSGDLGAALRAFGATADTQILFSPAVVRGRRNAAVQGRLSVNEAMDSLLADTELTFKRTTKDVILIAQADAPEPPPAATRTQSAVQRPARSAEGTIVEEVIVTAGKRLENIQDVPASVLVVSDVALERANIRDFDDMVKIAPSVTITKTSQPANNSINIRGIGTYAYSIAAEPSVAVVIDDVPQAFQAAAFSALVDVQQVEVLRGPQNTLFGKSASAGVINITTQPVTDEFTARVDAMTTDDHEYRVQATVSGPITDTLRFRLAANNSDYRGNVRNLTTGSWLNGQEDTTVRGKLVWTPTEDWSVTLSPYYTKTDASCCTGAVYFLSPGATTGGAATGPGRIPQSQYLAGITPGPNNRSLRMDVDARGDAEDYGAGLKITRELGEHSLASISSYDRYQLWDRQDTDGTDIDFSVYQPISPPGGSANGGWFDIRSTTQEFRLTSPEQRLRYVSGLYFSDTRSERYFVRGSNTLDDYNVSPTPSQTPSNLPTSNSTTFSRYLASARATNYALFGQGNYGLTDKLDFLAGLRVNHEEIEYTFHDLGNGITFGSPKCSTTTPSGIPIETCNDDTSVTGRTGFQYRFTPDLMAFATFSRGYKGMAYDLTSTLTVRSAIASGSFAGQPLGDVIASTQPVPPETVNSYEVGFKGTFFDRSLVWNVTAFYMDFSGFQAQSRDGVLNQNRLNSVGQVTSRGVETEIAARFGDFTLNGGGAYNRAVMEDFPNATCYSRQSAAEGCVDRMQDLSGKPLFNTPKWNFNLNGQYDWPLSVPFGGSELTPFVTAGYRWQSEVVFNLLQDPDSVQGDYGIANFGGGVRADRWKLTAFVNNLFDQSYALTKGRESNVNLPPGGNAISWKPARDSERYFGVRASVNF